jgi:hypothetical protein
VWVIFRKGWEAICPAYHTIGHNICPPPRLFPVLVQDYSELSYWSKLYLFNFSVTYVQILKTKFLVALGKPLVLISLKILLKKNEILNEKSHLLRIK